MSNPRNLSPPRVPSRTLARPTGPHARPRGLSNPTTDSSASSTGQQFSTPSWPVPPAARLMRSASTGDLKNLPRQNTDGHDVFDPGESLIQWRAKLLESYDHVARRYTNYIRARISADSSLNPSMVPFVIRPRVKLRARLCNPPTRDSQRRYVAQRKVVQGSVKDQLISKLKRKVDADLKANDAKRRHVHPDVAARLPPGVELSVFAAAGLDSYNDQHDEEDEERAGACEEQAPERTGPPDAGGAMVGLGISTRPGCGPYDGAGDGYEEDRAGRAEPRHTAGSLVSRGRGRSRDRPRNSRYSFPGEAARTASPATQARLARWVAEKTSPRQKTGIGKRDVGDGDVAMEG